MRSLREGVRLESVRRKGDGTGSLGVGTGGRHLSRTGLDGGLVLQLEWFYYSIRPIV